MAFLDFLGDAGGAVAKTARNFGGYVTGIDDINARRNMQNAQNAELERQRRAQELLAAGNTDELARVDPTLASQYEGARADQAANEQNQNAIFQQTATRAVRAIEALRQRGMGPAQAFDIIASRAGGLFGSPEDLAGFKEVYMADPEGFPAAVSAGFSEPATDKGRYISTRAGIFDTQTREIVPGSETSQAGDPLTDARRRLLEAQIRKTEAAATAGPKPSKGQEALDRAFAKEVVDWTNSGAATVAANIARLEDANAIMAAEDVSGPLAGAGPIAIRSVSNPRSAAVQQQIQNAIQSSLKATLGAQFARVEGEQLLDRAFDPRQQEAENIRRNKIMIEQTKALAQAKQEQADYYLQNGTMQGYQGPDSQLLTDQIIAMLRGFAEEPKEAKQAPEAEAVGDVPEGVDPADWEYMTPEERAIFQ